MQLEPAFVLVVDVMSASKGVNTVVNCAGIAAATKTLGKKGPHPLDTFQKVCSYVFEPADLYRPCERQWCALLSAAWRCFRF